MANLADQQAAQDYAPRAAPPAPAYPASWLDHLFDWVRKAPVSAWLIYGSLWALLFLWFSGLAWLAGADSEGHFLLIAADGSLFIVYYIALMQHLDTTAGRALLEFRPLLSVEEDEFARLHYELTTLPAWRALLAGSLGVLITLAGLPFIPRDTVFSDVLRQPVTQTIYALANAIFATFLYHTVRQLRLVTRIHATITHINLFRRGPLYAFSRLTARTGFGWILGLSLGLGPRLGGLLRPQDLFLFWAPFLSLAALFFILPLVGIHRLLTREKAYLQDDVDQRIEAVITRVHRHQDVSDLGDLDGLKTLLDTLMVEREMVAKLPTWPWQPGTLAGFASALLLPLAIWFFQQILMQWLPGQ